ncbi:hypothetical protein PR048_006274 [Dryococelus australis]|uniref:Uncharacterized protein n=1 Tax=Dryococelus australis TaxID=614101 RepID=A0ABQ9IAH6_9NEOP|nr:hypothetical protein PR048_006274 [Dryococelus australis]
MHGWGKRDIPKTTRQLAASSDTIPACENPGVTRPRIEPGGGRAVSLLASHQGELGSILGRATPGFSHMGIVLAYAAGRRVFLGSSVSRAPSLMTSLLRAAQISRQHHTDQDEGSLPPVKEETYLRSANRQKGMNVHAGHMHVYSTCSVDFIREFRIFTTKR